MSGTGVSSAPQNTVKMPYNTGFGFGGGFGGYGGGFGGYPPMMMGQIAPNIPTPTSNFMYPGYNPWYDMNGAHQLTTNPYLNFMGDATNTANNTVNMLAQFSNMQGGMDPNLAFYNNTLAGGLTSANQIYKNTMANTQNAPQKK